MTTVGLTEPARFLLYSTVQSVLVSAEVDYLAPFLYWTMHLLIGIVSVLAIGVTGFKADPNPAGRSRRSDDGNPLQAVVDHLTQQMGQMQAQVQANKNSLDNLQQAVGFTVRTRNEDMHGFAVGQVVKFDNPVFNAGNGYNPASGIFTAPVSGTYVFFLQTLHHNNDDTKVFLDIMKNDRFLTRAHAGFTAFENGSTLAVTHLNQGDTIEVQVGYGSQFWGGVYTTFAGFRISSM